MSKLLLLLIGTLFLLPGYAVAEEPATSHGPGVDLAPARVEVGDSAPDATVYTVASDALQLKSLDGHVRVLVFFMGSSCTGCMQHLAEFGAEVPEFTKLGAELYGISADEIAGTEKTLGNLKKLGITDIPVLADPQLNAIHAFGTQIPDQDMSFHAVFVIDKDNVIRLVARGDKAPGNLPSPKIILAKVKELVAVED
ncbi:MAG: peroxiredoxin family protein [bacterium]